MPADTHNQSPLLSREDDKLIATGSRHIHTSTSLRYREIRAALSRIDEHKDQILMEFQPFEQEMGPNLEIEELKTEHLRNSVENCFNIGIEEEPPRHRQKQRYKTFLRPINDNYMDSSTSFHALKQSGESGSGTEVIEQLRVEDLSSDSHTNEM